MLKKIFSWFGSATEPEHKTEPDNTYSDQIKSIKTEFLMQLVASNQDNDLLRSEYIKSTADLYNRLTEKLEAIDNLTANDAAGFLHTAEILNHDFQRWSNGNLSEGVKNVEQEAMFRARARKEDPNYDKNLVRQYVKEYANDLDKEVENFLDQQETLLTTIIGKVDPSKLETIAQILEKITQEEAETNQESEVANNFTIMLRELIEKQNNASSDYSPNPPLQNG